MVSFDDERIQRVKLIQSLPWELFWSRAESICGPCLRDFFKLRNPAKGCYFCANS